MPRKLGRNLRKGHRAEDLGIGFLRCFAAVAHIRQEDDVGIDAIATLLRPSGRLLVAGKTFAVQCKSVSVDEISYIGEEIDWFLEQRIPLFIANIGRVDGTFSLYPTSPARQAALYRNKIRKLTLKLTRSESQISRGNLLRQTLQVELGPPILTCTTQESQTDEFEAAAVDLMGTWLDWEYRNIELGRIGVCLEPKWTTWGEPREFGRFSTGSVVELTNDMRACAPYFAKLAQHISWDSAAGGSKEEKAFQVLAKWFRDNGIEVDFDDDFRPWARKAVASVLSGRRKTVIKRQQRQGRNK